MSFFDQKWDPTDRKNLLPQVNAWRNGHVNTASSPGYTDNARKAQNSASGATIVGGKIVKPVHAKPRENLPSNVHGFHNTNNEGQSMKQTYAGSASRFSGPDFIPSPQKSSKQDTQNRGSASFAGGQLPTEGSHQHDAKEGSVTPSSTGHIPQTSPSEAGEMLPPRLRDLKSAKTTVNAPGNTQNGEPSAKKDAAKATRSIKNNSNFPCTYETCTRGFMTKKAFKAHKEEDHAYCRECDEDYEDGEELLKHKVNSNNHICCGICGQDFRSESGRDKHFRQSHPTAQEVVCPGCELIFESGNSLVAHIYGNHCKTRDGDVSRRINELKIRESRAAAAVFMDRVSHRPNNTSALIAAMQPPEIADHLSAAQSVNGGVPVTHHLIDDNAHDDRSTGLPSALIEGPETSHGESYTVTAVEPGASDGLLDEEWPIPGQSVQKGKSKEESVIQGLNALKIGPPDGLQLKDPTNAHALTKPQKPMPMIGQYAEPTMPDHRGNIFTPESGSQHIIRTDWDSFRFVRNFNGDYDCPFVECEESYIEVNDLKWHLTSGYHQGTDPRCMKCNKVFKTIPGLVAHMERSDKCKIRETLGFGNVIHVVSGGFLGISGRHADGSIKIEVPDVPDDERYMLRYEGDDDDDEVPMLKPRLVLPPPHLRVGSTAGSVGRKEL